MQTFGPVPSRRLGRSLGINNIPPKICSYACAYCQLGDTTSQQVERASFYGVERVVQAVRSHVSRARAKGEAIDYCSFVPDGEPTLDLDLEAEIRALMDIGPSIAVITNASLLWEPGVRRALDRADWVSVKVDAVDERVWQRLNRPHRSLRLASILDGIRCFADGYRGVLASETMVVRGANDSPQHVEALSKFVGRLNVNTAYLSVPTRPPAAAWVTLPDEATLNGAFQAFESRIDRVELLTGYEGDTFSAPGDVREDLLGITAVHPMRRTAVEALLREAGAPWSLVEELVDADLLRACEHDGRTYFVRRLRAGRRDERETSD